MTVAETRPTDLRLEERDPPPRVGRGRAWSRSAKGVVVAVALLCTLGPIYWMLVTSIESPDQIAQLTPSLVPRSTTGVNYGQLVGHSLAFTSFLTNSVITSVATALVAIVIASLAGYSLSRGRYGLRGPLGYIILATQMLPLVVLVAPLYLVLLDVHLLNTEASLVIGFTTFSVPFGTWMMKGFFDAVPPELEEAARVDHCGRLQTLFRVVIPVTIPGLVTTGIFVFMEAWNNLLFPQTFINTLSKQTLPAGLLDSLTGQFKTDWGGLMAAAAITTIPLLVAFFAVQRYMVRGMTAGALAGE